MASNNLRIVYQNLVDMSGTTVTGSAAVAGTSIDNLKQDSKATIYRVAGSSCTINITFPSAQIVNSVLLPFCNLSPSATIQVTRYSGANQTGSVLSTVSTVAAPYQQLGLWNWGSLPLGVNAYSYGGGTYGRLWEPAATTQNTLSIRIVISDPAPVTSYLEFARLVVGSFWSPKYNTSYGLASGTEDRSTQERTESGNLITNRGIQYRKMNFDLNWLTPADRLDFNRILRGNGIARPLFISLFPDNNTDWEKEQSHQIYGKLIQLNSVTHPSYEMYSTSVEIEEV